MLKKFLPLLVILFLMLTGCSKDQGILKAEYWEDEFEDQYNSYLMNSEMEPTLYGGSVPIDYLEKYPYLKDFYEGYGFSIEYLRARGHTYALEDVMNTERPKPAASCLACKSADFVELLKEDGISVNSLKFEDVASSDLNTISCYDCHENTPGTFVVTREHLNTGLSFSDKEYNPKELACGQCHVEYYLDPETKEVILPWHKGKDTDSMIAYYDEINYSDWVHPSTGSNLLKAQHPEFETYQGGIHAKMGLTCVDCHMPNAVNEDGGNFSSHHWTSPLKTIEASCLTCHSNETEESLRKEVEKIQASVDTKMSQVASVLVELIKELTLATNDASFDQDLLNEARDYHRKAQFKWDFVFVENGEGFHNEKLAHKNLDEAFDLAMKALEILK